MKTTIIIIILLGAGTWFYFQSSNNLPVELRGKDGIYIGDSSICIENVCKTFKEILPVELTMVPIADELNLCDEVEKGWCKMTLDMATATLKGYFGYFDDSLFVRSFYRRDIRP